MGEEDLQNLTANGLCVRVERVERVQEKVQVFVFVFNMQNDKLVIASDLPKKIRKKV